MSFITTSGGSSFPADEALAYMHRYDEKRCIFKKTLSTETASDMGSTYRKVLRALLSVGQPILTKLTATRFGKNSS